MGHRVLVARPLRKRTSSRNPSRRRRRSPRIRGPRSSRTPESGGDRPAALGFARPLPRRGEERLCQEAAPHLIDPGRSSPPRDPVHQSTLLPKMCCAPSGICLSEQARSWDGRRRRRSLLHLARWTTAGRAIWRSGRPSGGLIAFHGS